MKHFRLSFKYGGLFALLFCLSSFVLLDPRARLPVKLLQELAPHLDPYEIDVLQNWRSKSIINSNRAILAPLANWEDRHKADIDFTQIWIAEFRKGFTGGMAAIKESVERKDFWDRWKATSEENRIFISFTESDRDKAYTIRDVLQQKGYTVFIYLNEAGEMKQTAEETGAFMSSAGQHYIIDSKNARTSGGVAIEAQILETEYHPQLPKITIYGRDDCGRTKQLVALYKREKVNVNYKNIDLDKGADAFTTAHLNYLDNGLLPLVTVNGRCIKAVRNNTITSDTYRTIKTYQDICNLYMPYKKQLTAGGSSQHKPYNGPQNPPDNTSGNSCPPIK